MIYYVLMSEIVNGITINSAQIKKPQQLVKKKSERFWLPRLTHWHTDKSVSLGCRHKTRIVFTLGFAAIWVWWFLLAVIWCCLMCRTILKAWPLWYSHWMQKSAGAKLKLHAIVSSFNHSFCLAWHELPERNSTWKSTVNPL